MRHDADAIPVDPARLEFGRWCHRTERTVAQGDINGSYSADRIGMGQPVRKPFTWRGAQWVCTGMEWRDGIASAEAYRLVDPWIFDGELVSYATKVANAEAARADPNGFYHGMAVKHAGVILVLSGPPVTFVEGEVEQPALF